MNEIAVVLHVRERENVMESKESPFPPVVPIILLALSRRIYEGSLEREYSDIFSFDLSLIIESRAYPQRRGTAVSSHHLLRKGRRPLGRPFRVRR